MSNTDFRPLADALRAELAKPFAEEDVMTEQNAIERVAKAVHDEAIHVWPRPHEDLNEYRDRYWQEIAAAAIAEHNAYLRGRVQDADVVDAVAGVIERYPSPQGGTQQDYARAAITAALDVLLGKEAGE